ncbi:hypothetical protein SEMRO_85_G045320.1 [Seminavis robusta]|uniref:Uncharacterized protein n=1 Tax=Seminavis robusta TaxID=568900 RepID=A0A9N8DEJ2_9STRA|nr:hypothetical protein SEMRO_85_G045320.1 [Seminavis robusta]|eukprot:Sro85_g045320.1 n/a (606) ;mRNA; f:56312-58286
METNALLQRALEVLRTIPEWGVVQFERGDALISVGMDEATALSAEVKARFDRLLAGAFQRFGRLRHLNTYDENCNRAFYLAQRIQIRPDTSKPASVSYAMLVAGFQKKETGPGKAYVRVSRRLKAAPPLPPPQPLQPANNPPRPRMGPPRPVAEINVHTGIGGRNQAVVSPLSAGGDSLADGPPTFMINAKEIEIFNTPPLFGSPEFHIFGDENLIDSSTNISWREIRKNRQASIKSDISHLTTTKDPRRTTQAAQVERQTQRELDNIRKSMYKAATVIFHSVQKNENTLAIFKTPDAVARSMNNITGIDCVSGREIATAVRVGNVGKSPPRLGRKGEVPVVIFEAFCSLVFTACAIEQANCKERLTREKLKSTVGEILNSKRAADGLEPMNDSKFYARIENAICHLQDLNKADNRESLRVLWLTYQSQSMHYKNWEKEAVRLGFARPLNEDENPDDVGHIVWKDDRLSRVLQFDEMNIALDGADSTIGGRASRIPTATTIGLADSGTANEKSGTKMTIMFGINFAGEVLPPLLLFPTKAQNPSNYKLKVDMAKCLPQLEATLTLGLAGCILQCCDYCDPEERTCTQGCQMGQRSAKSVIKCLVS